MAKLLEQKEQLDKDKKESIDLCTAESIDRHETMQEAAVQNKYGGLSMQELQVSPYASSRNNVGVLDPYMPVCVPCIVGLAGEPQGRPSQEGAPGGHGQGGGHGEPFERRGACTEEGEEARLLVPVLHRQSRMVS